MSSDPKPFVASDDHRHTHIRRLNYKLRKQVTQTPWRDKWELLQQGYQPEHVAIWRARSFRPLPHAVEITAALQSTSNVTTQVSCENLRYMYACMVVRAINGLADPLQQTGGRSSVSRLCDQLGIPDWMVDIRHEATHNQLPSLSILQLAVSTMLDYLQANYWDPVQEHYATQQAHVREFCLKPSNVATLKNKKNATKKPKLHPQESFEFGSSSSDDYSEDDNGTFFLGNSAARIGTSQNMFALLAEPSKKRKSEEVPPTNEKLPQRDVVSMRHGRIVKQAMVIPMEIAYAAALDYLVWKQADNKEGVLVMDAGTKTDQQKHLPLVNCLCSKWPGFATALLIHLVDWNLQQANRHDPANDTKDTVPRQSSSSSIWMIRHLLSDTFRKQMKPKDLEYPLNSLCDRCLYENHQKLAQIFAKALGDKRVSNHGLVWADVGADGNEDTALVSDQHEPDPKATTAMTSLEAMEAMLSEDDKQQEPRHTSIEKPKSRQRTAWVKCQSWESCAIGSLPGYPS